MHINNYIDKYIYISLSLYIYIYIYIHIHVAFMRLTLPLCGREEALAI